jgi:hypothetical protein
MKFRKENVVLYRRDFHCTIDVADGAAVVPAMSSVKKEL